MYHFCVVGYLPRSRETLVCWRGGKVNRNTHIYCERNVTEYLSLWPVLDLDFQKVAALLKLVAQWCFPSRVQRLTYTIKGKNHWLYSTLKKLVVHLELFLWHFTFCHSLKLSITLSMSTIFMLLGMDIIVVSSWCSSRKQKRIRTRQETRSNLSGICSPSTGRQI